MTAVPERTAPPAGLNVGVAAGAKIVYAADATPELVNPDALATALIVTAAVIAIGVVYSVEEGPGSVPSVV